MSVKYPPGTKPINTNKSNSQKPKKIVANAANRGMDFENDINVTNDYYLEKDIALIYKRPTPINVVHVDYTHGAKITHAYFEAQSTTDYNGVYKGKYIDFEAKSSKSPTSFPLSNIARQQINHLENVIKHGGIAFFLINMSSLNETYLLDAKFVCEFYGTKPRKSIPIDEIRKNGHLIKEAYRPRYDYLPIVDELYLK